MDSYGDSRQQPADSRAKTREAGVGPQPKTPEAFASDRVFRMEPLIHVLAWAILFFSPLVFILNSSGDHREVLRFFHHFTITLSYCLLFYLNYGCLIPRYLFSGKTRAWIIVNATIMSLLAISLQLLLPVFNPGAPSFGLPINLAIVFFLKDIVAYAIVVALAATIRLSKRLASVEAGRREEERLRIEAEQGKAEAELKNLRNQLNPHFLLNTLNNIYALIEFDKDKAQNAVAELSRLLRYALYDSQQNQVPLCREMDFIRNYIALMEIRISSNTKVSTSINVPAESRTPIAPLLFISLIENAFKHGVSPTEPSFIDITLEETPEVIQCDILNSCFPKKDSDKSGSGIGLEQVGRRLELLYPGRYEWKKGPDPDAKVYRSTLSIRK